MSIPSVSCGRKRVVSFLPRVPRLPIRRRTANQGLGWGRMPDGQKSRAPTRPPSFPSSSPPFRALDEMMRVQVTADLQPCSTVFRKANQCRRHANQRRESAAASRPLVVAGKSPRKAGQTPTPIRQRAGTVAPALGEPWRRHPSQRQVAQRKLSSPATGEKGRQLSTSWRVCVCVCVPRALTRLNRLAGEQAIWATVRKARRARTGREHTRTANSTGRRTRDTNLILPPTKTNPRASGLCSWLQWKRAGTLIASTRAARRSI